MKEDRQSEARGDSLKKRTAAEESVVRASVVERGRKLLADPAYPDLDSARELARILLPIL
jgi:hypothetical protein